jgi:hypothetical protein
MAASSGSSGLLLPESRDLILCVEQSSDFFQGKRKITLTASTAAEIVENIRVKFQIEQPFCVQYLDSDFNEFLNLYDLDVSKSDSLRLKLVRATREPAFDGGDQKRQRTIPDPSFGGMGAGMPVPANGLIHSAGHMAKQGGGDDDANSEQLQDQLNAAQRYVLTQHNALLTVAQPRAAWPTTTPTESCRTSRRTSFCRRRGTWAPSSDAPSRSAESGRFC